MIAKEALCISECSKNMQVASEYNQIMIAIKGAAAWGITHCEINWRYISKPTIKLLRKLGYKVHRTVTTYVIEWR